MTGEDEGRGRFSRRTAWDRTPAETGEAKLADGVTRLDLTISNPTLGGFSFDERGILQALSDVSSLRYTPDAAGLLSAREAVVGYYAGHGATVLPEQVVLTASTSEGYSHLFRLLCDPGDEVLIAQPSYPLFAYLADLCDVRLRSYPLFYDHGWWIDAAELQRAITPRTRAVVLVDPNNPTGHVTSEGERVQLRRICQQYGLSLLVDEVFLDFPAEGAGTLTSFAAAAQGGAGLVFVLSGLSKIAALPQMKVGWVVVCGEAEERAEAMARLELIADTYLSVGTPVQHALPAWLAGASVMQGQIRRRIAENLRLLRLYGLFVFAYEAGWSAMVRLPRTFEEGTAAAALRGIGVMTHAAEMYGMEEAGVVVVSLIVPPERMREALERVRGRFLAGIGTDAAGLERA